jgi:hypothetical protein
MSEVVWQSLGLHELRVRSGRLHSFQCRSISVTHEGPEEAILSRFSTDEIVTVIGIVVCMVAAVAVTVVQNEQFTGLERFSLTIAKKFDRTFST